MIVALTDTAIRNAKPRDESWKLWDEGGLHLVITPSGTKSWRSKIRVGGKEKLLTHGQYPAVTLSDARDKHREAKRTIANGGDPALEKQRAKHRALVDAGTTFDAVAGEYIEKHKHDGDRPWAEATIEKNEWLRGVLRDVLGAMPITAIQPADVLAAVRKIERRGNLESARRALQFAGSVMRYGVATARLTSDPTRDLKGALSAPRVKHRAAILEAPRVGALMRAIDGYEGKGSITRALMLLSAHLYQRPGELRQARWEEIDLDKAVWTIPAEKMKMRREHHVPLSRQAVEMLRELHAVTGPAGYVFPSIRSRARPASENTVNAALRRMGFPQDEMSAHGFRTMASSLLNESGKWQPDAIERALAHGDDDRIRGAYNRTPYWQERVTMAQWWSDYLGTLADPTAGA
jgi:integrase